MARVCSTLARPLGKSVWRVRSRELFSSVSAFPNNTLPSPRPDEVCGQMVRIGLVEATVESSGRSGNSHVVPALLGVPRCTRYFRGVVWDPRAVLSSSEPTPAAVCF